MVVASRLTVLISQAEVMGLFRWKTPRPYPSGSRFSTETVLRTVGKIAPLLSTKNDSDGLCLRRAMTTMGTACTADEALDRLKRGNARFLEEDR